MKHLLSKSKKANAVLIARLGTGKFDWTRKELREIDRKTRKLHRQADVDRVNLKTSPGRSGFVSNDGGVAHADLNNLVSSEPALTAELNQNFESERCWRRQIYPL